MGIVFSGSLEILWLHVGSDALIAFAYYLIPATLLYLVVNRQEVPFRWMFVMFSIFIFACGTTHLMDIWTVWNGTYRLEGVIKLFTVGISVATALLLIPLLPKVMALRSPMELEAVNRSLEREISERERIERVLRQAHDELERRVQERTADLLETNRQLQQEIAEREQAERALRLSEERLRFTLDAAA